MCDLRSIAIWLSREARAAGSFIEEWEIWVALACGLLLWTLAYQAPYTHRLDLGGNLQTGRRYDDDPFLGDTFNAPEPADPIPEGTPLLFRWSGEDSTITFPGLGGGRWLARIAAVSGRPKGAPVLSRWDDGTTTIMVLVDGAPRVYELVADADRAGDLRLHFVTPPLNPPGDPRSLGLVMSRVVVEPAGGVRIPATRQLALLAMTLALAYLLLRRLALARRPALAAALALAALAALLLARERMAVTLLAPRLPMILAGCYAFGIILEALGRAILHQEPRTARGTLYPEPMFTSHLVSLAPRPLAAPSLREPIIALIVLAAVLRLGGMLHPHARFSDDGLNANNLIGFTSGEVYFTEGLTSEAGGGRAPYPPGQYIVFAPTQLLITNDSNSPKQVVEDYRRLLWICNALWDSLAVGVLWYALRQSGRGPRAALAGAALYVLPLPMLKSLSIGEFANVFGQAMALPLLALLALHARGVNQPRWFAALMALMGLSALGHLGVSISIFFLLGYLGLVWLIRLESRRTVQALLLAGLLVGALVALFYYTAFWDVLLKRVTSPPAETDATLLSVTEKLTRQTGFLSGYGLHVLTLVVGVVGTALIALRPRHRRWREQQPALGSLLIAWWGGTLLSFGLLLYANQAVRWYLFIYPALCLGAGPALAGLWPRGRAGRLVAAGLLGFLLWYGLSFWVTQIADYMH